MNMNKGLDLGVQGLTMDSVHGGDVQFWGNTKCSLAGNF